MAEGGEPPVDSALSKRLNAKLVRRANTIIYVGVRVIPAFRMWIDLCCRSVVPRDSIGRLPRLSGGTGAVRLGRLNLSAWHPDRAGFFVV